MVRISAHFDGKTIVPDEPLSLPAGERIDVIIVPAQPSDKPLKGLVELAETFKPDEDWPADGAKELDHYLYGTPKRNQ